jgi:hypothetical protein
MAAHFLSPVINYPGKYGENLECTAL